MTELKSVIAQQQKNFARQEEQIEVLASGLQKVSVQVETIILAPRVIVNNP